jgi:hypothetical protein
VGRQTKSLDADGTPEVEFAIELRYLKEEAGLTFGQIAEANPGRDGVSATTLKKACSGGPIPGPDVVRQFVSACGGDVDWWLDRRLDMLRSRRAKTAVEGDRPDSAGSLFSEPPPRSPNVRRDAMPPRLWWRSARQRRRWLAMGLVIAGAAGVLGYVLAAADSTHAGARRPPRASGSPETRQRSGYRTSAARTKRSETTGGLTHTWSDYRIAGGTPGPSIATNTTVTVSCAEEGFAVDDGDTWWYRIESNPWNGHFYATADAFYNNASTSGPLQGTPQIDPAVPKC